MNVILTHFLHTALQLLVYLNLILAGRLPFHVALPPHYLVVLKLTLTSDHVVKGTSATSTKAKWKYQYTTFYYIFSASQYNTTINQLVALIIVFFICKLLSQVSQLNTVLYLAFYKLWILPLPLNLFLTMNSLNSFAGHGQY